MGRIRLEIINPAGTLRQAMEVPDDRAVDQVAQAIAQKMQIDLPSWKPGARFILVHQVNQWQLDNNKTFAAQGIADGAVLHLRVDEGRVIGRKISKFLQILWQGKVVIL